MQSWSLPLVIMGLFSALMVEDRVSWAQGGTQPARSNIESAWDRVEATQSGEAAPAPPPAESPSLDEYLTVGFGAEYVLNAVSFSSDPTISSIVDDGPNFTVTPTGTSFPQVFESSDHKLGSYLSAGTRGLGHPRINAYVSAVLKSDLDGTTEGSPFQSILDDHDGTKLNLSNLFIEMKGLGTGRWLSRMNARVGRQFMPHFRVGVPGSAVMDGGKVAYVGDQSDTEFFIGRWAPFYESVESTFVSGGRFLYELYPDLDATIGLAPYVESLYFNDGDGESALRHTYGIRGRWKRLDTDVFFSAIDADPVEFGMRGSYAAQVWTVYGRLSKRVSSDDFSFDIFLTSKELTNERRLQIGNLEPATEFALDADYQVLSWLTLGAGFWIYALDDEENQPCREDFEANRPCTDEADQTGFDNSFQEFVIRASVDLEGPWGGLIQYRYRNIDRASNDGAVIFNDISRTGETSYNEINAEVSYFWRQFLKIRVGGYYGVYDTQSRLDDLDGTVITGGYLRAKARVSKQINFKFLFGLDRGNEDFNPDIDIQYTVRAGVDIYY